MYIISVETSETLVEDFCGVEPVTHPPDLIETRPPPDLHEDKLRRLYRNTQSAILGGVLAVIFLLVVLLAIIFGRYWSQHKGAYLTQEDDGAAGTSDANIAVSQGSTGHHVGKKREWFI
jgi:contactin associated protein-like 2